jgi:hypothetical protein
VTKADFVQLESKVVTKADFVQLESKVVSKTEFEDAVANTTAFSQLESKVVTKSEFDDAVVRVMDSSGRGNGNYSAADLGDTGSIVTDPFFVELERRKEELQRTLN